MRNKSLLLFLLLLFFACYSCADKISIIGKWKPVEVDNKYISSYHLSNDDIKNMLKENSLEFKQDGKLISIARQDTGSAIYNYDEKEKTLTMAQEGEKTVKFSIDLQKNTMVLN